MAQHECPVTSTNLLNIYIYILVTHGLGVAEHTLAVWPNTTHLPSPIHGNIASIISKLKLDLRMFTLAFRSHTWAKASNLYSPNSCACELVMAIKSWHAGAAREHIHTKVDLSSGMNGERRVWSHFLFSPSPKPLFPNSPASGHPLFPLAFFIHYILSYLFRAFLAISNS